MARAIKILGYILAYGGVALILIGLVGIYTKDGFSGLQEVLSPFNVWQWIAVAITLAPGVFFLWLGDWLAARKQR